MARAQKSSVNTYGIVHTELENGSFYQCVLPGGYADRSTGIKIDGPRAILDKENNTRTVIALTDIPEPVQIPHFKVVLEFNETSKQHTEVLRDFNAMDEQRVHEGFRLALQTGIIRMVSDEEMKEKYPETWENRKEKYIFRDPSLDIEKPYKDMFEEAEKREGTRIGYGNKYSPEHLAALKKLEQEKKALEV